MIRHEDIDDGALSSKLHKVWCCPQCCVPCNCVFYPCRKAVSGSKRRFIKDGFDLDLAYITPRIIVHGFPATGLEHFYRNPRYEIRRFMDKHHSDHYKMFNFCCEPGRGYHPSVYYGRVERYPFKDHNTPPLETMTAFANSAKAWLEEDPANVVNMHCKAGKGRAGLMCCVLLVRTGAAQSAIEAMDLYDRERVTNNKGLTVTSQRKFVIFYEMLWRQFWGAKGNIGDISAEDAAKFEVPPQPEFRISGVEVLNFPSNIVSSYEITIHKITNFGPQKLFDTGLCSGENVGTDCDVAIQGNFKIFVKFKKGAFSSLIRLVELQHNTLFMNKNVDYIDFGIDQLDIKKKMKPKLGPNVVLRLRFGASTVGTAVGAGGYALVKQNADAGADANLEMINLAEGRREEEPVTNIQTDETIDSQSELLKNKKDE